MNSVHVNNISPVYAAGLVLIALFISYRQKLTEPRHDHQRRPQSFS